MKSSISKKEILIIEKFERRPVVFSNGYFMNYAQEYAKGIEFYTSLRNVERWLEINLSDYDWHITDIVSDWDIADDPIWMNGKELSDKINEWDYRFTWAVLSAFPRGYQPFLNDEPYADGNPDFWIGSPEKQLKKSLFEVICWDGSATLFIGLPDDLGIKLVKNAPGIKNLDEENRHRKSYTP
jgi:hypothetical protein